MSIDPAFEKFHLAVLSMATSTEPPARRLFEAWTHYLKDVHSDDLPTDLRRPFTVLRSHMSRVRSTGDIDDIMCRRLSEQIVGLYGGIAKAGR